MSAVRRAAALMRECAEAVLTVDREFPEETGGPDAFYSPAFIEDALRKHAPIDPPYSEACERSWKASGEHLASWHPAVALAVADWLEMSANKWDQDFAATQRPSRGVDEPPAIHYGDPEAAAVNADWHAGNALTVARIYLGAES